MTLSEQVAGLEDKYIKLWEVARDLYDVIDLDWLETRSDKNHRLLSEGILTMNLEATREALGYK